MFGLEDELQWDIEKLKKRIRQLTKEKNQYKKLAKIWMKECDELKAKYEPSTVVMPQEKN